MITSLIFLIFNALFGFIWGIEVIDNFFTEKVFVIKSGGWELHNDGTTVYVYESWPVFVFIILTVAFCSPTSAIVWKMGSSTGGTDLIAYYVSNKYRKPVGNFLMVTGYSMAIIGILFLFISKHTFPFAVASKINGFDYIFGAQTIGTFLYIMLNAFVINLIYPKYKKVKMKIDTKDVNKIIKYLEAINFWHPYKIQKSISGYSKLEITSIETIVLLLEFDDLASKIKEIDNDAWISVSPISKIYGRFDYSKIE